MEGGGGTTFNEGAPEIAESELEYDVNDKKSLLGEGSFGSVYKVRKKRAGSRKEGKKKKKAQEHARWAFVRLRVAGGRVARRVRQSKADFLVCAGQMPRVYSGHQR